MLRYIITLLCLSCLSLTVQAEEIKLQKNYPNRYTVVKGDTLWGISGKFLANPWQWPKVWNMNRSQIKNPHLIYPGDVVMLDMSSGYPRFRLLHETITMQPGAVVEPLEKEAIYSIPPNIIGPFLSQPLLIENGELDNAPRIVGAQDDRLILSPSTRVYIQNLQSNEKVFWNIYRPGKPLVDPDTNEVLGTEALYLGDARITKFGQPASADIVKAEEEIFIKDRLVESSDGFVENFIPHAPTIEIDGKVIKIHAGVAEAGPNAVVILNKGSNNGLEEGHILALNRSGKIIKDPEYVKVKQEKDADKKDAKVKLSQVDGSVVEINPTLQPDEIKLPDERIGLVMVFRTFKNVSYALVMQTSSPVHLLDTISTP